MKLDKLDKKILYILANNSRLSFHKIARLINSNHPTVWSRVNKMYSGGIIKEFNTHIFRTPLGCKRQNEILLKFHNTPNKEIIKIIGYLKKHPRIIRLSELQGNWNISFTFVAESIDDTRQLIKNLRKKLQKYSYEYNVLGTHHDEVLKPLFFYDKKEDFPIINFDNINSAYHKEMKKGRKKLPYRFLNLDDNDLKLLKLLRNNSRITFLELQNATNLDKRTIDKKLKNLIKEHTLRRFSINLNYEKMGYICFFVRFQTNVIEEENEKFYNYIKNNPKAYEYFGFIDNWDTKISFMVKDKNEIYNIISDLLEKFGGLIRGYEIILENKNHKFITYPTDIDLIHKKTLWRMVY